MEEHSNDSDYTNEKQELKTEDLLTLISIYLEDRNQRDSLGTDLTFKFFYASIIVGLLPNLSQALGVVIPVIPSIVFRLVGIALAVFFIYASNAFADRLNAMSSTYSRLIKMLPAKYQRNDINHKYDRYMSNWVNLCMFIALLIINITMCIFDIIQQVFIH